MEDTICNCATCGKGYPKAEMHYRKSEIYPYRNFHYYCTECNEKRVKRQAMKVVRTNYRNSSRTDYRFKH